MKYLAGLLLGILLSQPAWSASIQGAVTLHYTESAFSDKVFKREFGDTVKATCRWYAGEFFGRETSSPELK